MMTPQMGKGLYPKPKEGKGNLRTDVHDDGPRPVPAMAGTYEQALRPTASVRGPSPGTGDLATL